MIVTTRKNRNIKKIKKGGKVVSKGAVGCLFNPSLSCSNKHSITRKKEDKFISKLMLSHEADNEIETSKELIDKVKKIKNYNKLEKFLPIISMHSCSNFVIKNSDINGINTCNTVKGFENIKYFKNNYFDQNYLKNFKSINYKNAGVDLLDYLNYANKTKSITSSMMLNVFLTINNQLIELCEKCLFILNDNNIIHTDIKRENLTIKENNISLIDFGRAIIADGKTIPDIIYLFRLDFNILPSMIIFNYVKIHNNYDNISNKLKEILINHIDNANSERLIYDLSLILNLSKENLFDLIINLTSNVIIENKLLNKENLTKYLYNIYFHNLDLWGIVYTYFNIIIVMLNKFPKDLKILKCYEKITILIKEFIIKSFNEPINRKKLVNVLRSLNN